MKDEDNHTSPISTNCYTIDDQGIRVLQSPTQTLDWDHLHAAANAFSRLWCREFDAPDVAQDALLRLISQRRLVHKPLPWLFVVTRRIAAKYRDLLTRPLSEASQSRASRELVAQARPDLPTLIRAVIDSPQLNTRDRLVLTLTAMGYTHAEIAGRIGCARGDIGQYVSRALKRL